MCLAPNRCLVTHDSSSNSRWGHVRAGLVGIGFGRASHGFPGGTADKEPAWQSRRPETRLQSLSREDRLEKGVATRSSILARRIPWTEEPGSRPRGHGESTTTRAAEHTRVLEVYWFLSFHQQQLSPAVLSATRGSPGRGGGTLGSALSLLEPRGVPVGRGHMGTPTVFCFNLKEL